MKISARRALSALLVSTAITWMAPAAAQADEEEPPVGDGEVIGMEPPMTPLEYNLKPAALATKLIADAQNQLMDLYTLKEEALNLGQATSALDDLIATVQATVSDLTGLPIAEVAPEPGTILGSGDEGTEEAVDGTADITPAAFMTATSVPPEVTLNTRQVGQQKNWWCGPATGYVVLKYKGFTSKSNVTMSQSVLAGSGYMRTDQHYYAGRGATNFGDHDMSRGLNNWAPSLKYQEIYNPGYSRLRSYLRSKIPAKRPLPLGTFEAANGQHYNYHPKSRPVWHWITGYGYKSSGDIVKYQDSATSIPGWDDVTPARTMYTSNMAKFISGHGVVV